MFVSLIGTWIQTVAQSWLIFQLTKSAFLLGLTGFLSTIPVFFFSLFGGVVADRVSKRSILLITQNAFMVLAFILAMLTQAGLIRPWQIMVIASLNGIVMAFDGPCRQAVIVELVGRKQLPNAIALNSAAFNSARIIGPALAGILIAAIGMSGCFYLNAISFLAVILALFLIKFGQENKQRNNNHFMEDLKEGLRFLKNNRIVLALIALVGITSLFGISYIILMPVFAGEVLKAGANGLGILMSSTGIGALIAALVLARLGDFKAKGKLVLFSGVLFSFSLMFFALSKNFIFSALFLINRHPLLQAIFLPYLSVVQCSSVDIL